MRRFLFWGITLLIFLVIVSGSGTYALAASAPFLPGDSFYPLQVMSEEVWGLTFNQDGTERTGILLNLMERRLEDLAAVAGTADEATAVASLDRAYDQVVSAIAEAHDTDQPALQLRLDALTNQALALLNGLSDGSGSAVASLRGKIETEPTQVNEENSSVTAVPVIDEDSSIASSTPEFIGNQLDDPRLIPFPPGADILEAHKLFALTGGHENLLCSTCHTGETYKGTPSVCVACHADDDVHEGVYGSDCAICHSINNWQDAEFDHTIIGSQDCVECHEPPPTHYQGSCRNCHTDTNNFSNVFFDHTLIGNQDCAVCHTAPVNHYAGACSSCHTDTNNFSNAFFNHATIGSQDCSVCHNPPVNHYTGACSSCHTDTNNFSNAFFNHAIIGGTDCAACHAAPTNHFPGACTNCHQDTGNFRNVNFSHAGLADCAACHAPPANHYPGQCSNCHNTDTFGGASFNHTFPMNHEGANGECARCHPGNDTQTYTCFGCHNQQEMIGEHNEEGIGDLSNCVRCHADGREPNDDDDDGDDDDDDGDDDDDDDD